NTQGDAISRAMLGTTQRVLIEGISKKESDFVVGKTDNNRIVTIPKDESLIGQFVNVKITNVKNPKRLVGEII
ncbi:MAG TPA: TRAM domain-containing protein, partial [Methylophilaceae bacterium]|nr:TRAM domain-containing protein [Methylophilaceae bacterium]